MERSGVEFRLRALGLEKLQTRPRSEVKFGWERAWAPHVRGDVAPFEMKVKTKFCVTLHIRA